MQVVVERSSLISLNNKLEEAGGSFRSLVIRSKVVLAPGHVDSRVRPPVVSTIYYNFKSHCYFVEKGENPWNTHFST